MAFVPSCTGSALSARSPLYCATRVLARNARAKHQRKQVTLNSSARESAGDSSILVERERTHAVIALTRESGKNGKLCSAAQEQLGNVSTIELPCVCTVELDAGCRDLSAALRTIDSTWVVVSSPESARIFADSWVEAGRPEVRHLAAIGDGTGEVLQNSGLQVTFSPTKATFQVLSSELPYTTEVNRVLYPASKKASIDNVRALEERGFLVRRMNTYTSETAEWTDAQRQLCATVDIVTFASPTTVRGWVSNAGLNPEIRVACIGETSARAAKKAGFRLVYYPPRPGVSGWVDAIRRAMEVNS